MAKIQKYGRVIRNQNFRFWTSRQLGQSSYQSLLVLDDSWNFLNDFFAFRTRAACPAYLSPAQLLTERAMPRHNNNKMPPKT